MSDLSNSDEWTERNARLERRVERERTARREAERLLESKSLELFMTNLALQELADTLERRVEERTERIRSMEAELRHSQKMEAVGLLAGGVAHDFNNVLMVIGASASLLADADGGDREQIISELVSAVQRGRELTARLLAFSRQEAVEEQDLNLSSAIHGIEPLLQRLLTERVRLAIDVPHDLHVRFTRGGLDQILFNLAANARDAMPGGGTMGIRAAPYELQADEAAAIQLPMGPHVLIDVSDTGIGMNGETARRAFDPFFSTKPVGVGTGLGLATVYSLIRQAKGNVTIRSAEGVGTRFRILLPRVAPVPVLPPPPLPDDASLLTEGARVLVVDDDPLVRSTIAALLQRQKFDTVQASTAEDALQLLGRTDTPFDLVVSDVRMPGMNGCDLALAIRALNPSLPVLLMSGYVDDHAVYERIEAAGLVLMSKPFNVADFLAFVKRTIHAAGEVRRRSGSDQ